MNTWKRNNSRNKIKYFLFILLIYTSGSVFALPTPWVSYLPANQTTYGVYHSRKTFELGKVPERLVIHVSADNRYNHFENREEPYLRKNMLIQINQLKASK